MPLVLPLLLAPEFAGIFFVKFHVKYTKNKK